MWFARGYYLLADGKIVRWFGLSLTTFTVFLGIILLASHLLECLLPYTLFSLFVTSILGWVVQSHAKLIKRNLSK